MLCYTVQNIFAFRFVTHHATENAEMANKPRHENKEKNLCPIRYTKYVYYASPRTFRNQCVEKHRITAEDIAYLQVQRLTSCPVSKSLIQFFPGGPKTNLNMHGYLKFVNRPPRPS